MTKGEARRQLAFRPAQTNTGYIDHAVSKTPSQEPPTEADISERVLSHVPERAGAHRDYALNHGMEAYRDDLPDKEAPVLFEGNGRPDFLKRL
ncbi:hypothetical protein HYX10_04550 [Candidatus Woesearchaeota archaeon]|nr:hypothetical protein [Candidatus Woesearchaeota archaeon]